MSDTTNDDLNWASFSPKAIPPSAQSDLVAKPHNDTDAERVEHGHKDNKDNSQDDSQDDKLNDSQVRRSEKNHDGEHNTDLHDKHDADSSESHENHGDQENTHETNGTHETQGSTEQESREEFEAENETKNRSANYPVLAVFGLVSLLAIGGIGWWANKTFFKKAVNPRMEEALVVTSPSVKFGVPSDPSAPAAGMPGSVESKDVAGVFNNPTGSAGFSGSAKSPGSAEELVTAGAGAGAVMLGMGAAATTANVSPSAPAALVAPASMAPTSVTNKLRGTAGTAIAAATTAAAAATVAVVAATNSFAAPKDLAITTPDTLVLPASKPLATPPGSVTPATPATPVVAPAFAVARAAKADAAVVVIVPGKPASKTVAAVNTNSKEPDEIQVTKTKKSAKSVKRSNRVKRSERAKISTANAAKKDNGESNSLPGSGREEFILPRGLFVLAIFPISGLNAQAWISDINGRVEIVRVGDTLKSGARIIDISGETGQVKTSVGIITTRAETR